MEKEYILIDPEYTPPNIAGKSERLDTHIKTHVIRRFEDYERARTITAGGRTVDIKERWDELYQLYMSIRIDSKHNYDGQADVFIPVTRRAVNIIESEASNALFGRSDYYSVESANGSHINQFDMREHAFNTLKYYSDTEDYISPFELALKQELIYGATATRVNFKVNVFENIARELVETPIIDELSGEPLVDEQTGRPKIRKEIQMKRSVTIRKRPTVEVIDIYRLFINSLIDNPEDDDIIYQNEMSRDEILDKLNEGIYTEDAVKRLLKQTPNTFSSATSTGDGEGKASLVSAVRSGENDPYEVLQFEGLFIEDPEEDKNGMVKAVQYFIDIGNRDVVLRCQANPLIGEYKTFCLCNYDSMIGEFYSDGVIDPIKGMQYEINDKENQSLDAVSFDLNAPFEILKSAGLTDFDVNQIYKVPHKGLFVRERDSIRKIQVPVNVQHLSSEVSRLLGYVDNTTGSTSLAGGAPTGTQADRSGKALSLLQNQTRSQFSRLIRKYERKIIEATLQKAWKMTMQYSDEPIAMQVQSDDIDPATGERSEDMIDVMMSPAEIIGEYVVKVSGGSQYLKERELKDSMLEFMSVLGMSDVFMAQVDPVPLLKSIARASAYDMSQFVNPNNLYQKQKAQIDQLTKMSQQATEQMKMYGKEVNRLQQSVNIMKTTENINKENSGNKEQPTSPIA